MFPKRHTTTPQIFEFLIFGYSRLLKLRAHSKALQKPLTEVIKKVYTPGVQNRRY